MNTTDRLDAKTITEAVAELVSVRDLIRWAASRFNAAKLHFGHGTTTALDEAAYLVLHTLHLPPGTGDNWLDTRVTSPERLAVMETLTRRVNERVPAPYLTGEAWFAGLPFNVDRRVLIPRSPLAELIESRFEPWIESYRVEQVLDLCTGSGCIAVACALAFPDAQVTATDISDDALDVALSNLDRHGLVDDIRLAKSDLFDGLEAERYDIIVSNPPYVDAADMAALPPEFLHEPRSALAAGDDGLDLVRRLLRDAADHLTDDGILVVEVGNSATALEEQFPEVPFTWIEFERGEGEVFLLTADQVREFHGVFAKACRE